MKKCRITHCACWLFVAVLCFCSAQVLADPLAGPGDPAEREIQGTHSGSGSEETAPSNMALVSAGKVTLGWSANTATDLAGGQKNMLDIFARAVPEHTVKVDAFYCDLFELTNIQWAHYLQVTGQKPSPYLMEHSWKGKEAYPEAEAYHPVRNVTYREAWNFARWCGKRIPTEAEWMRAARGDKKAFYAWGDDWNRGKNCTNRRNSLSPVGSYAAGISPFGMYDMTASVWEWTSTKFQAYPKYKPPKIKIGKKKVEAAPGFNAQQYIIKGGHYLMGELPNRLEVREATLPSNSIDSLGFRCIKDLGPGITQFKYAMDDLDGSVASDFTCDLEKLYAIEITDYTDSEPPLLNDYDFLILAQSAKIKTTAVKITKESPDKPQPIGIISTNKALVEPNLPPGSYVLAYRQNGLSKEDKKKRQDKEAEKKRLDQLKKVEEELQKRAEERQRLKEEKGISISRDDVARDKEEMKRLEEIKKEDEEFKRQEEERKAQLEKMGLVSSAKEHVDFPRDKNLIVFMNSNDTIVAYIEILGLKEDTGEEGTTVNHNPETGMTDVQMSVGVMPSKIARFNFSVKLEENPF